MNVLWVLPDTLWTMSQRRLQPYISHNVAQLPALGMNQCHQFYILGFDVCAQTAISCSQTLFYLFIFDHFRHRLEGSNFSFYLISLRATRMEMELYSCTACIYNIALYQPDHSIFER